MSSGGYIFEFEPDDPHSSEHVFSDPSSRRRNRAIRFVLAVLILLATWVFLFFAEILEPSFPFLGQEGQKGPASGLMRAELPLGISPAVASALTQDHLADHSIPPLAATFPECAEPDTALFAANAASTPPRRVFAFLPSAVEWAHLSLSHDCGVIDTLMPDWFSIADAALHLDLAQVDAEAMQALGSFIRNHRNPVDVFPVVRPGAGIEPAQLLQGLEQPDRRLALAKSLARAAQSVSAAGICVDLGLALRARPDVVAAFMQDLGGELSGLSKASCLILGASDPAMASPHLKEIADFYVLKLFDEPWLGSPAAPLAADAWVKDTLTRATQLFGAEHVVAAIGTHSADWVSNQAVPVEVSYSEAMVKLAAAGAEYNFAEDIHNGHSIFVDATGARHQLWMLDAASFYNHLRLTEEQGITNIAVWPLGGEDPAIWPILADRSGVPAMTRQILHRILPLDYVNYTGTGPFIRLLAQAKSGYRFVSFDEKTRHITGQDFPALPQPARIERYGRGQAGQIVLTFDDGPHPEYTGQILDVLKENNAPAVFFVVGENVASEKALVQRMIAEGHEVGSHSFWHPHMNTLSETRSIFELNMLQKLLNSVTGRGTLLFREPYQRSDGPLGAPQAEPLRIAQGAGYISVGSDITPPDWEEISAEEIVAFVEKQLGDGPANIITLHDAGNDRSETVRAIPLLIEALRAKGYEIVSLAELLGVPPQTLMPETRTDGAVFFSLSFALYHSVNPFLSTVMLLAVAIGATRAIGILVLSLMRRRHRVVYGDFKPPVTVVIPAFNEESSIIENIESVLALRYPDLRIIVIDDGSVDGTFERVLSRYSLNPRVKIIAQLNRGKWSALNTALRAVTTEIVICIDADTRIDENAVARLVSHFKDAEVGAVAGKVLVGNRTNLLTRLQALEYITAQNIDRRAAELMNAILVVPGAIGAWRVSAIHAAGGYSGDTLTEDADMTMSLLRKGYRVVYEENATASTPAPPRIKQLLAQRLRWTLGMMQAGWKHRGAALEGRALGLIALPELLIYGYLLPLLAPVADFLFLKFLLELGWSYWDTGAFVAPDLPMFLLLAYLLLPLMDVLTAMVAMAFDTRENPALVLLFPLQRFFYRQLLYYSVIRALLRALTGRLMKWTKVHRAANPATQPRQ